MEPNRFLLKPNRAFSMLPLIMTYPTVTGLTCLTVNGDMIDYRFDIRLREDSPCLYLHVCLPTRCIPYNLRNKRIGDEWIVYTLTGISDPTTVLSRNEMPRLRGISPMTMIHYQLQLPYDFKTHTQRPSNIDIVIGRLLLLPWVTGISANLDRGTTTVRYHVKLSTSTAVIIISQPIDNISDNRFSVRSGSMVPVDDPSTIVHGTTLDQLVATVGKYIIAEVRGTPIITST